MRSSLSLVVSASMVLGACGPELDMGGDGNDDSTDAVDARLAVSTLSEVPEHTADFPAPEWSKDDHEAGRVDDIIRVGNTIYIGGNFVHGRRLDGTSVARSYLAAVDATTYELLPFAPKLDGRVYVLAVSTDKKTLYAGGQFDQVDGLARHKLVAFDLATGRVSAALPDLGISGNVRALAVNATTLYVGGAFTRIAGQARGRLAAVTPSGALLPFDAEADADVRDVILDAATHRVIAAGWFSTLHGKSAQRHLAALDDLTAAAQPWASPADSEVLDITRAGNTVFAAIGGPGGTAAAYDLTTGNRLWFYKTDGNCQGVAMAGGYPVFGMHGDFVAPKPNAQMSEFGTSARIGRKKIFMLAPDTGVLQAWAPFMGSTGSPLGIWALRGSGTTLYAGGDFTRVGTDEAAHFAVFTAQ